MIRCFYDIESYPNLFFMGMACPPTKENPNYMISVPYVWDGHNNDEVKNNYNKFLLAARMAFRTDNVQLVMFDLNEQPNVIPSVFGGLQTPTDSDTPIIPYGDSVLYGGNGELHMLGYNSSNYDEPMVCTIIYEQYFDYNKRGAITPVSAKLLHDASDVIIDGSNNGGIKAYQYVKSHCDSKIFSNMTTSGRLIDICGFNEKQQHMGLKFASGVIGLRILESDKTIGTPVNDIDEFIDEFEYNMTDIYNTFCLSETDTYISSYRVKTGLMEQYNHLYLDKSGKKDYRPLRADSTSASLTTRILAPYDHLKDIPAVSFMYPYPTEAARIGIEPFNVLDYVWQRYCEMFPDPNCLPRRLFGNVYTAYRNAFEGTNFDGFDEELQRTNPYVDLKMRSFSYSMPYFNKDCSLSSGYVTFSAGGIHGAEYNLELYKRDMAEYEQYLKDFEAFKAHFNVQEGDAFSVAKKDFKTLEIDGVTRKSSEFVKSSKVCCKVKRPELFLYDTNEYNLPVVSLNERYTYTSVFECDHDDFESYYPRLLSMLQSFANGDKDVYTEVFREKQRLGVLQKDESYSKEERAVFKSQRNGVKLVLNSASGRGDGSFDSNICVPNKIISMRIIGQLFTFLIGQEQTYLGAVVGSTNTDGLFSSFFSEDIKKQARDELAKKESIIGVAIEPEPEFIISKDTNNRIELEDDWSIIAVGGELSNYKGYVLDKNPVLSSLSSQITVKYLIHAAQNNTFDQPVDMDVMMDIANGIIDTYRKDDPKKILQLAQIMVKGSSGSALFTVDSAAESVDTIDDASVKDVLHKYNRLYIVNNGVKIARLAAKSVTSKTIQNRLKEGLNTVQFHPVAFTVGAKAGLDLDMIKAYGKDLYVTNLTGYDFNLEYDIRNEHYDDFGDLDKFIDNLNLQAYVDIAAGKCNKVWLNLDPAVRKQYK